MRAKDSPRLRQIIKLDKHLHPIQPRFHETGSAANPKAHRLSAGLSFMKKCSYCGKEYPDETLACEIDGNPLQDFAPLPPQINVAHGDTHRKQLTRIAPLRAGVVLGVLYGVMALIFVPFLFVAFLFGSKSGSASAFGGGMVFTIFLPIIYGVMGFICGVIAAAVYNAVTKFTGGLEFEVRNVPPTA